MGKNLLVINCDFRETRVALIEDGVISELHLERAKSRSTVGDIVLGRVTRVLPGMQAAFIDIGQERAAFLHVEDLIKPDDFEAYLSKSHPHEDPSGKGEGGKRTRWADRPEGEEDDDDEEGDDGEDDEVDSEEGTDDDGDEAGDDEADGDEAEDDETDDDVSDDDDDDDEELIVDSEGTAASERTGADAEDSEAEDSGAHGASEDEDPLEVEADEKAEEEEEEEDVAHEGARRRGRRRRRRSGGGGPATARPAEARSGGNRTSSGPAPTSSPQGSKGLRGRQNGHSKGRLRSARSVPITEVVKEGDQVIVQVSKEPIGTKGARVTSHVSLPGRYAVYLPTVEHVGISRRIGSAKERERLRAVIEKMKPPSGGLIVRTVASGLTKKALKTDIGYLIQLWGEVSKRKETAKAPMLLHSELDLALKTARDLFTDDIEKLVIDDKEQFAKLKRFVEVFMPHRANDIELYSGEEPLFDAYGIEDEISRALSRKVPLPSGGYLIIDQAEALAAIDVNTGRYVGKGSKDLEETALKTNLEAVEEIAYQLRFRNIGGLVILDLIDMDVSSNREKVWRALEQRLAKDKAKTTINRISELGLLEMTRKRTRESLSRMMHEPCFYCDGTGQIQSRTTIAYEILRQIRRERKDLPGYSVMVNAHPAIVDLMTTEEKDAVADAERRYMRRIEFTPRREYHIEQFDLAGR
ncbi:MAG: Rne/Rng family ribonuclease [Polyangiaceae bacterium]|nr:Rne/Rng family ribonuclease [Polyangiaceae bacterium]